MEQGNHGSRIGIDARQIGSFVPMASLKSQSGKRRTALWPDHATRREERKNKVKPLSTGFRLGRVCNRPRSCRSGGWGKGLAVCTLNRKTPHIHVRKQLDSFRAVVQNYRQRDPVFRSPSNTRSSEEAVKMPTVVTMRLQ
jgi:hypothetical protein